MICLYLYQYLLLWDVSYIIVNELMSTFQHKFNHVNLFSCSYEILADKAFIATDDLISQSFVVVFVHPTYMQIALIWGFPAQLILWKSVYWLWRYKLNEVCNNSFICCHFPHLILPECFCSSSSTLIYNSLHDVLFCYICNIFLFLFLFLAFSISLSYVYMCCS